jgi:NADH:ubiquinone oxidoreductase subunit C
LTDITAVDYAGSSYRFHVHYFLLSITYNVRFQVITQVKE